MKKFNWNRFYDELEEGDPAKFPYWMFFLNEIGDILYIPIRAFFSVMLLVVWMGLILSVMAHSFPDYTFSVFKSSICQNESF